MKAQPGLLPKFSAEVSRTANPLAEPILVNGALRALGCAPEVSSNNIKIVSDLFKSLRAQRMAGETARSEDARLAQATLEKIPFEPVESVASATLIQTGAAGSDETPPIEELLDSARETSLPDYRQFMRLRPEYNRMLAQEAVKLLDSDNPSRRGIGAGLAVRLWLARSNAPDMLVKLSEAAEAHADESCLRALLMIASSDKSEPKLQGRRRANVYALLQRSKRGEEA